jgi:putative Ca2+/H+ antiporter (TMEM165/GDT1 family)
VHAFWKSFAFVFLSEMGDKTQIVSMAFGAEYKLRTVLLGVFLAVAALMTCTVALGVGAGHLIPTFWINIFSAVAFIGFGLWALRPEEGHEGETKGLEFGPLIAVMTTFFLAELGDKTVLASITMGSQLHEYFPVWSGSILGMYLADVIAIVFGRMLGKHLPEKLIKYSSAAIFIGAGIYTFVDAFAHR